MRLRAFMLTAAACAAAAVLGGRVSAPAVQSEWYRSLRKPTWGPPDRVFAPVWTTLYTLMALSGGVLWSHDRLPSPAFPRFLFVAQLSLNLAWSVVFFGKRSLGGGLAVIALLWLTIAGYIATARRISATASWLFVPYAVWVSFAAGLNAWIWANNRSQ